MGMVGCGGRWMIGKYWESFSPAAELGEGNSCWGKNGKSIRKLHSENFPTIKLMEQNPSYVGVRATNIIVSRTLMKTHCNCQKGTGSENFSLVLGSELCQGNGSNTKNTSSLNCEIWFLLKTETIKIRGNTLPTHILIFKLKVTWYQIPFKTLLWYVA